MAIVLAGGAARRMGGVTKPTRPVGGVPLLARVLAAVSDARPRVVVGPDTVRGVVPDDVQLTLEDPPGGGPVAALAAGLAVLGRDTGTVALLAADLPFITVATIHALRRGLEPQPDTTPPPDGAVLVDDDGRPQWLCGVWRVASLRARLEQMGYPRDRSMRHLAEGLRLAHVSRPADGPPEWFDCDTDDDLRRAQSWLPKPQS